jgi:hypothetical protein
MAAMLFQVTRSRGPTSPVICLDSKRPNFNVEKRLRLLEPHPKMPNMALSPEETKDTARLSPNSLADQVGQAQQAIVSKISRN